MLSLFKRDPAKGLKKQHLVLLEKAMQAQRKGDIRGYSKLTAEAEEILSRIETIEAQKA